MCGSSSSISPHLERHVGETERLDESAAARDGPRGRVYADEPRAGECQRHRHEVAPVATAKLQHAGFLQRRGADPEQGAESGQPVGVGLGKRVPRVRTTSYGDVARTAQNCLFCLTSQPALMDDPRLPSGFCGLYSTWIFEKLSETASPGRTSPPAPPVW